ncbi:FAD-dependent oxidoreductase [Lentisphaera profundi]|uniref:FAD-dependent oxidoreductase n=1 Tax=Lentisphaera profundi TaxID=1658616 RepID=A0ABY7VSX1_9BACT|nr:FAD-dependent oxidoreductase [Lentisphaera profundi]WDE97290.1 FAD-dependent oxidoreductase [Lentisphaera profundi]
MRITYYLKLAVIFALLPLSGYSLDKLVESKASLPLAYDVDVLVAGSSLAGIEAACAAADNGASVLVIESRPYLGYDICANQKLWLDPGEKPQTEISQWIFDNKRQTTPLKVKGLFDKVLLKRNVQFLTGSFPAELLVNENGKPAGMTMVNRSGRQAIRAKVIIDATPYATLIRQLPNALTDFQVGEKQAAFTVIGGDLKKANEIISGKQVPNLQFSSKHQVKKNKKKTWVTKNYPVYHYDAKVDLKDDTYREHSKALHKIRSMVSDSKMADHSEGLLVFPERMIHAKKASEDSHDLNNYLPKGFDNIFSLNAYAGIKENSARLQLLKSPYQFAPIGKKLGAEAAKIAKQAKASQTIDYIASKAKNGKLIVSEQAKSFRFNDRPQLVLSDHDLPVLGRWDVVVVGAGTSGAPAALGAARAGAKTLAIEYMDELGGVGTAGLISTYWYGFRFGYTAEVDKALGTKESWNQIQKSEWLRQQLLKSGAELWFASYGCGVVTKGNKVVGIVVATPFGRGIVLADVVVDGTGNSDLAAAAKAKTQYSISKHGDLSVQISNYSYRKLGYGTNNPARYMLNDNDIFDRWHLKLSARQEAYKNPAVHDMGQLIPSRDRRRIIGEYVLTTEDILTKRTFPDTISHHKSNFDAGAHPDTEMFLIKDMKGPVFTCDMPYRSVIPQGLEGLLVIGLGASADRDAMTLVRMQPDLQNQGYAVGMAAAMAVLTTGGNVRDIDIKMLQRELVNNNCLNKRVLTDRDSFPLSQDKIKQAVKELHALTIDVHQKPGKDDTHTALAVVISHPKESIPLLKGAYTKTTNPQAKINFARILAILGDQTGKKTLIEAVKKAPNWGDGWDYSNQRKYANTYGPVDRIVLALGFLNTKEIHPPLLEKLQQLNLQSPLSHYKALCLALRMNKDKSLAEPLAKFLKEKKLKGHTQALSYYSEFKANKNAYIRQGVNTKGGAMVNNKFKELLIAALLFECGDYQNQGRKILEAYTKDVNGHFAEYANKVLTHGTAMSKQ